MTAEQCFMEYALAFEETFQDDDWSRLARYFTDDATYEIQGGPFACKITGRDAIFEGLKKSIDGFDRRCDERRVEVTRPPETASTGQQVTVDWEASYERAGAPTLTFAGRSVATVVDGRITRLVDEYSDAEMDHVGGWMMKYGRDLDGSYV